MLENLHTHSPLCQHASGRPVEYALKAVSLGMETLGFSDHTPFRDNRLSDVRMKFAELPTYLSWIDQAQAQCPQIQIFRGLECEGLSDQYGYYQDVLLGEYNLDYLIGAAHTLGRYPRYQSCFTEVKDTQSLRKYVDQVLQMIQSKLFLFIAHPDLFGCRFKQWGPELRSASRDIASAAKEAQVPLEINGNGFRKQKQNHTSFPLYPWPPFWEEVALAGAPVVINSDAHHPDELADGIQQGTKMAKQLDLVVLDASTMGLFSCGDKS